MWQYMVKVYLQSLIYIIKILKVLLSVWDYTGILQIGEAVFFQSGGRGIRGYVGDIWETMAEVLNFS